MNLLLSIIMHLLKSTYPRFQMKNVQKKADEGQNFPLIYSSPLLPSNLVLLPV